MPCHALRASCFVDPWGVVYPCITYSRPIGRLRDTGMRLDPIWNAADTRAVQGEIWRGSVRNAGLPARRIRHPRERSGWPLRQSICRGAHALATAAASIRAFAMNVTCFADAVIQAHLDRAVAHHVTRRVSVVIAAKQEAPSIAGVIERTRRYASESSSWWDIRQMAPPKSRRRAAHA